MFAIYASHYVESTREQGEAWRHTTSESSRWLVGCAAEMRTGGGGLCEELQEAVPGGAGAVGPTALVVGSGGLAEVVEDQPALLQGAHRAPPLVCYQLWHFPLPARKRRHTLRAS